MCAFTAHDVDHLVCVRMGVLAERLAREGKLDSLRTTAPTSGQLWLIRLGGFLALAIGLALLVGILWALYFGR